MLIVGINYKVSKCAETHALLVRGQQGIRLCIFVVTHVSKLAVNVDPSVVDLRHSKKVWYNKDQGIKVLAGCPVRPHQTANGIFLPKGLKEES